MTAITDSDLANEIATILDENKLELPVDPAVIAKRYLPSFTTADLETLQIVVLPSRHNRSTKSRRHSQRDHEIIVAPHWNARLVNGTYDDEQVEEFCNVVDKVQDILERVGIVLDSSWQASEAYPIYDAELLKKENVLRSIITVSLRRIARDDAA